MVLMLCPTTYLAPFCIGQRIRVVGSGLSPNGMAFCPQGMLSTALLDKIISVDTEKQQVTVQAGARVQQVLYIHHALLTCSPYAAQATPFCMHASKHARHAPVHDHNRNTGMQPSLQLRESNMLLRHLSRLYSKQSVRSPCSLNTFNFSRPRNRKPTTIARCMPPVLMPTDAQHSKANLPRCNPCAQT